MRIASINFYVGNSQPEKDLVRIRNLNPTAIGFQEAWNHIPQMREQLTNHKVIVGGNSRAAREVAVALRETDTTLLNAWGKEVSEVSPENETAVFKSRWITVVKFRRLGVHYALLNYHGNAAVQDRSTGLLLDAPRAREWIDGARTIERTIKTLQGKGYKVFVTGDFNYRTFPNSTKFFLHYWSPQKIFSRCKLNHLAHGLDYVAWPKLMQKVRTIIIPKAQHGGDHDWVIVDVVHKD